MKLPHTLAAPFGELTLRDERPGDAGFVSRLFAEDVADSLWLADMPEVMRADLIALQYRAREAGHDAAFPGARRLVAERGGEPVARLVLGQGTHIVDIAVDRPFRRQGVATALLRAVMQDQPVTAEALVTNQASLALFRTLGFCGEPEKGAAHVRIHWVPG